jgi:hypothetical protein
MSSAIFYRDLLWWSSHLHRGIAKSHGHQIALDVSPMLCGHCVEECELCPELNVATIQDEFGGRRDMTHAEILEAEKILRDLFPGPD